MFLFKRTYIFVLNKVYKISVTSVICHQILRFQKKLHGGFQTIKRRLFLKMLKSIRLLKLSSAYWSYFRFFCVSLQTQTLKQGYETDKDCMLHKRQAMWAGFHPQAVLRRHERRAYEYSPCNSGWY